MQCEWTGSVCQDDSVAPAPATALSWDPSPTSPSQVVKAQWTSGSSTDIKNMWVRVFNGVACTGSPDSSHNISSGFSDYTFDTTADGTFYFEIKYEDHGLNTTYSTCSPALAVSTTACSTYGSEGLCNGNNLCEWSGSCGDDAQGQQGGNFHRNPFCDQKQDCDGQNGKNQGYIRGHGI